VIFFARYKDEPVLRDPTQRQHAPYLQLNQFSLRALPAAWFQALRAIEYLNEENLVGVWNCGLSSRTMNEMRRKRRLKKLSAYFGWKEPRFLYLNDCTHCSRLEHQQVNAAHTRVTCFAPTYEKRQLMASATSWIPYEFETAIDSPVNFLSDGKMK